MALGNMCVGEVRGLLGQQLDHINVSTFMHRVSRLVSHSEMAGEGVAEGVEWRDVMAALVARLDALVDRQLELDGVEGGGGDGGGDGGGSAEGGPSGGAGSARDGGRQPREGGAMYGSRSSSRGRASSISGGGGEVAGLRAPAEVLGCRSLAVALWACSRAGHALSPAQLDRIGAVVMLRYGDLVAHHLSMILLSLLSFQHRPFGGRLFQVGGGGGAGAGAGAGGVEG